MYIPRRRRVRITLLAVGGVLALGLYAAFLPRILRRYHNASSSPSDWDASLNDNGASARVTTMALPEVDAAAGGRPRGADVPLAADNRPLPEVRAHQPDRANGMERPEAAAAAIQPLPAAVPPAPPAPPSGPPLAPQPAVQNAPLKTSPPQRPAVPAGVSRRLQTFYYPWYATAEYDGAWKHWNHERITHWDARHAKKWSTHAHQPPDDIGASFYPVGGPYSSSDPAVIERHMLQMLQAGIGTAVVSWYPPGEADGNGQPMQFDALLPLILDTGARLGVQVALHLEPFKERSAARFRNVVDYITQRYGKHPAIARLNGRILLYAYDSYQIAATEWAAVFSPKGSMSVRGTAADVFVIGLLVEQGHLKHVVDSGFDGFYTYFATDGFTYGSTLRNWSHLARDARQHGLAFVPCVGPGYEDTAVRPWNAANTRQRDGTAYYDKSFTAAIAVDPSVIAITSFNEWHEGTQIEPAQAYAAPGRTYLDYGPDPSLFLHVTRKWLCSWLPLC